MRTEGKIITPRLHSMYFFAQTTTSAVSRPGGFEKCWIESVVSCRVVEEVKSFLLKSCSWHLLGNRGSDQQRNLKVAPLSSRCSWCWRPPVTMCTVRRQFYGSRGCGNSGRSFVCFRHGALPAALTQLWSSSSRWQHLAPGAILLPPRATRFQKRSERPGEALSQLTDIKNYH